LTATMIQKLAVVVEEGVKNGWNEKRGIPKIAHAVPLANRQGSSVYTILRICGVMSLQCMVVPSLYEAGMQRIVASVVLLSVKDLELFSLPE
jgi:hypothetical protein